MRKAMIRMLTGLESNGRNTIIHRDRSGKLRRTTFSKFGMKVDETARIIRKMKPSLKKNRIGILGPSSYEWLLMDLACMKAGVQTVALPESSKPEYLDQALKNTEVSMVLADVLVRESLGPDWNVRFFDDAGLEAGPDPVGMTIEAAAFSHQDVLDDYTVTFSSGTTGTMKSIPVSMKDRASHKKRIPVLGGILALLGVYRNWGGMWFKRDNRLIVFLPFSHFVQRGMAYLALQRGVDLIVSSPKHFLRDLVIERPNILISAPLIYETLAVAVRDRVSQLTGWRKVGYKVFKSTGVCSFSDGNPIKRIFRRLILGDTIDMLGGRPDYFVSGMAAISMGTLKTFEDIGVRIYQGYGMSETDNIALSTPGAYKIGSVGRPMVDIKIGRDSEILVRKCEDGNRSGGLAIDEDGYLRTGDLGYQDKDGFLYLQGRKDDLIVLTNGWKIMPQKLEDRIRELIPGCIPVLLTYDNHTLSLILGFKNAVGIPKSTDAVRKILSSLNHEGKVSEAIASFHLSPEPFTIESGLVTGVGKLRRKAFREKFQTEKFEWVHPHD